MKIDYARKLRANQTDAERLLWQKLRSRRLGGVKFRRQHPVGPYIIDFLCIEHKLAIELDGGQHSQPAQSEYDDERTVYLKNQGITVLRFWNHQVFEDTQTVLEVIFNALGRPRSPSP